MTHRRAGPAGSRCRLGKAGQPGEPVGPHHLVPSDSRGCAPRGRGRRRAPHPPASPPAKAKILQDPPPGSRAALSQQETRTGKTRQGKGGCCRASLCFLRDGHGNRYRVPVLPVRSRGGRKGEKSRGGGKARQSQDQTHRSRDHSGETAGQRGPTGAAKTGACIYVSI